MSQDHFTICILIKTNVSKKRKGKYRENKPVPIKCQKWPEIARTRKNKKVWLAHFYLNPFTYVGYKNKYFFPYQSLYFEGYSTMPMSYFELDPVGLIWLLTFLT